MSSVTVFAFGSHFEENCTSNDIDLLLVHDDLSNASCAFAIKCKRGLAKSMYDAHITVLSKKEEQNFGFAKAARAKEVGIIRGGYLDCDLDRICDALNLSLQNRVLSSSIQKGCR